MIIPFVGAAYTERSLALDAQNSINWYMELDPEGKFPSALYRRPGLKLFCDGSSQKAVRGMFSMNNDCFVVIDNKFYTLDKNAQKVDRGDLSTFEGPVSMQVNGWQNMVVDGSFGYIYQYRTDIDEDPADIWSQISDEDFVAPITIAYQDGYGLYAQQDSQKWWSTKINDFSSVTALSFFSSSGSPDWITTIVSTHQEIWILNRYTTEVWYNTGDVDRVFQRRQTLLVQYGCTAPFSVARTDNGMVFWLSNNEQGDGLVVRTEGYSPKVISTPAVSAAISSYEIKDDAKAFVMQKDKHIFYVLTFPTAGHSWVYDILTDSWFEWSSMITTQNPSGAETKEPRWLPSSYTFAHGKHLVGDSQSGNIYELDWDSFTDNGDMIPLERTGTYQHSELKRVTFNEIEVAFEAGVGLETGQGSKPRVMLSYSKDNGRTWSSEQWRSVGTTGQYAYRARWQRLGQARTWLFKVRMSDPVKWVILGMIGKGEVET